MVRYAVVVLLGIGVGAGPLFAGKYNRKLSIGDAAPAFRDLEGIDGKKHSLDDFKSNDVLVIVMTCNECPVSAAYEDRIIAFAKKYRDKVAVAAINVCQGEDESLSKMRQRAKEKGFPFPYLRDPSQQVGRAYGASKTPEFFVLNKDRKIVYMGALDDELDEAKVKRKYLEGAVEAVLKGNPPAKAETPAYGCGIEYGSLPADRVQRQSPDTNPPGRKDSLTPRGSEPTSVEGIELKTVKYRDLVQAVRRQRGKVIVIDVWADFCLPCKREFHNLVELHKEHGDNGLVCMSVTLDKPEGKAGALKFLQKQKATFANFLLDEPQEMWAERWHIQGPPAVFVFDRQGRRAGKFDSENPQKPLDYKDIKKLVRELLEKP